MKHSCEKKEPRDSVDGVGYGNGTSMVLGEGKKPSGEEVSLSLRPLLLKGQRTDQQGYSVFQTE
jgi:hypothetical protein